MSDASSWFSSVLTHLFCAGAICCALSIIFLIVGDYIHDRDA